MSHQFYPLPQEYLATGIVGVLLYVVVMYFSARSIFLGIKSKSTKNFFISVIIMAMLELPRYLAMAITEQYSSKTAYCFHIVGGIFFFISFSIVCRQWSGLLQLGSYFRVVYGIHGLVISNVVFAFIDVIAVIICATSASLMDYFNSTGFEVLTFIEGVKNCVYSIFLSYYGIKLVHRFWHFSTLERQAAAQKRKVSFWGFCCSSQTEGNVFTKVVFRLTMVLVLSSVCFISRICMLMAKMIALHTDSPFTTRDFSLFGFLWFTFADFIPRVLPTLAFIFLMRTRKPAKDQIGNIRSTSMSADGINGDDDFQFVQLAGDEESSTRAPSAYAMGKGTRTSSQSAQLDEDDLDTTVVNFNRMHNFTSLNEQDVHSVGSDDDDDEDDDGMNAIDKFFSILTYSSVPTSSEHGPK